MVIVLLNMLIAMITNSFQKIEVRELRTTQARGKKREREGKEQDARSQEIALSPLLPCFETGDKFPLKPSISFVCTEGLDDVIVFIRHKFSAHSTLGLGESVCCGRVGRNMRSEREGRWMS